MKSIIMLLLLVSSAFAETITYDFNQGPQGWAAHFANYPVGRFESTTTLYYEKIEVIIDQQK